MNITVLGICATQALNHETTSFLVNSEKSVFLIDCGPAVSTQLLKAKVDLTNVTGIFVSHCHGDHLAGFPYLLFMINVARFNKRGESFNKIDVYGSEIVINTLKTIVELQYPVEHLWDTIVNPRILNAENGFDFKHLDLNCLAFEVDHAVPTLGIKVSDGKKVFTYSCDTRYSQNVINNSKNVDLLIHEAFCLDSLSGMAFNTGHSTAKQAGLVAKESNAKKLCLCHPLAFALANKQSLIDEAKTEYSGEVFLPDELEIINL